MWRKNCICPKCKKWAWDKMGHFPECELFKGDKPAKVALKAPEKTESKTAESKPVYTAFHRGGGKYDVSIVKGGAPAEGGDNVTKAAGIALAAKLNA